MHCPPPRLRTARVAVPPPTLRPELTPDWSLYDAADQQLRDAAALLQQALNAESVEQEEALWTRIISDYGGLDANWVPDLVGRAYGNRGNARSRQGQCALWRSGAWQTREAGGGWGLVSRPPP